MVSRSWYLYFVACITVTSSSGPYMWYQWEKTSGPQAAVTLTVGTFDADRRRHEERNRPIFRGNNAQTGTGFGDLFNQRVGRPVVQQPPQVEFDMFRNILLKANSLQDLMRDDSNMYLGDDIALSRDAFRDVFGNHTKPKPQAAGVSRMRVHPGKLYPSRRRIVLRKRPSTQRTRLLPTLRRETTPTTTTTSSTTTRPTTTVFTKRRKLFVRLRRTEQVESKNKVEANTFRKSYERHSKQHPKKIAPPKVGTPYLKPDHELKVRLGGTKKDSHLSNPEGLMKRRFETFKDLQIHTVRGGSASFSLPDVEVVYKKAIIYKTSTGNRSVEMFCFAGYHKAASITWRVNERPPDEFLTIETAYTKRGLLNIIVSRLRVSRLDVLPSITGKYMFQCVVNIDDADAQSRVEVDSPFNNSCIDNTDCEARNAICTFGKCECKDFLPVPLRSKHTTCRSFGYIGWPCSYDEQCSYAVQNSLCASTRQCACGKYYRPSGDNQSCILKNGLGAACASQSDCDAARAKCRSGHCRCPEGTTPRAGMCVGVSSSPLLERRKDRSFNFGNASVVLPSNNSSVPSLPGSDTKKFNGAAVTTLPLWRVWSVMSMAYMVQCIVEQL